MESFGYREQPAEQARIGDLLGLLPEGLARALDVGARDGYITCKIAGKVDQVTALDLTLPAIVHPRIACVQGDVTALAWPDGAFDIAVCSEVLEHIPPPLLPKACAELARVAARYLLIGVPHRQDLRLDCSTCQLCGKTNPPWGHVNSFDAARLRTLFPRYREVRHTLVGQGEAGTNWLAARLMDMAGNPFGTYIQDEPCIHCGGKLGQPKPRNLFKKCLSRASVWARRSTVPFAPPRAKWIHMLLEKES